MAESEGIFTEEEWRSMSPAKQDSFGRYVKVLRSSFRHESGSKVYKLSALLPNKKSSEIPEPVVVARYGSTGSKLRESKWKFDLVTDARSEYIKKKSEKLRRGYSEVSDIETHYIVNHQVFADMSIGNHFASKAITDPFLEYLKGEGGESEIVTTATSRLAERLAKEESQREAQREFETEGFGAWS